VAGKQQRQSESCHKVYAFYIYILNAKKVLDLGVQDVSYVPDTRAVYKYVEPFEPLECRSNRDRLSDIHAYRSSRFQLQRHRFRRFFVCVGNKHPGSRFAELPASRRSDATSSTRDQGLLPVQPERFCSRG
jgi:hypothetical protein